MLSVYPKYSRIPHILAAVLLCAGFGILLYLALLGSSMPVYSVSELLKVKQSKISSELQGQEISEEIEQIQLYGNIAKLVKQDSLSILLQDQEIETDKIKVNYTGIIPNNLTLGQTVFLTGKYNFVRKEFLAYEIVTTCPSKYQEKQNKPQAEHKFEGAQAYTPAFTQDYVAEQGQEHVQNNFINSITPCTTFFPAPSPKLSPTPFTGGAKPQTKAE